jgi:hypothetical protein
MAVSGFLAQVERADLEGLRVEYPEAFSRPFHAGVGPGLDAWLVADS